MRGFVATLFLVMLAQPVLAHSASAQSFNGDVDVDLELVLAIDASGSVDPGEYRLQMQGVADAFRAPGVLDAIRGGKTGRIAVAIVIWADATVPKFETDWFLIQSEADALAFADIAGSLERNVVGGTGLGEGIAAAMRKFDRNGISGLRQVVDVSGDGEETPPREIVVTMPAARAMAMSRGVTINGLAILNEDDRLDDWYRNHVIAGPQSFVVAIRNFDDFADAMVRKLIREIEDLPKLGLAVPTLK